MIPHMMCRLPVAAVENLAHSWGCRNRPNNERLKLCPCAGSEAMSCGVVQLDVGRWFPSKVVKHGVITKSHHFLFQVCPRSTAFHLFQLAMHSFNSSPIFAARLTSTGRSRTLYWIPFATRCGSRARRHITRSAYVWRQKLARQVESALVSIESFLSGYLPRSFV